MTDAEFKLQRDTLVQYLKVKTEQADWHAVSDAANDLRVLEAERLAMLTWHGVQVDQSPNASAADLATIANFNR